MMNRMLMIAAVLFCSAGISLGAEPSGRLRVPDEAAQKTAVGVISEIYKPDYESAKTVAQKCELARKLLLEGTATKDDNVARFVLFRIARDIAAQNGDLATSFDAIDRTYAEYAVDPLPLQLAAATLAIKAVKTEKEFQACGKRITPLLGEAVAADRFDEAKSLLTLTQTCAQSGHDPEQVKLLSDKKAELDETAAEFVKVQPAFAVLQDKPTDAAANAAIGGYLCFAKGEWSRGVPMLALGNEPTFKAAAQLELDEKSDALKRADAWWKVAETFSSNQRLRTQLHAAEAYRTALPQLSGLTKTRVERLLAAVPQAVETPPQKEPGRSPVIEGAWRESAKAVYVVNQTGNRFRANASYIDPKGVQVRAVIEGTISPDRTITATLKHTQPSTYQSQKRTGKVSEDGKTIKGQATLEDGKTQDFEWVLQSAEKDYFGSWDVGGNGRSIIVIAPGGVIYATGNVRGRWIMTAEGLAVSWANGDTDLVMLAADGKSVNTRYTRPSGKSGTGVWKRK